MFFSVTYVTPCFGNAGKYGCMFVFTGLVPNIAMDMFPRFHRNVVARRQPKISLESMLMIERDCYQSISTTPQELPIFY